MGFRVNEFGANFVRMRFVMAGALIDPRKFNRIYKKNRSMLFLMKKIIGIIFFFGTCVNSFAVEKRSFIDSFTDSNSVTWKLSIDVPIKDAEKVLLENKIEQIKKKKFGKSTTIQIKGCPHGSWRFNAKEAESPVTSFKVFGHQLGWIIEVGDICGNTYSGSFTLIIPQEDGRVQKLALGQSKYLPKFIEETKDQIQIWKVIQNWRGGGTSGSTFEPVIMTLTKKGSKWDLKSSVVPKDQNKWPKLLYINETPSN